MLTITLDGGETCTAAPGLIRLNRHKLGKIRVSSAGGDIVRAHETSDDHVADHVPASGRLIIVWE